jgi:hypothetical protein
MKNKLVSGESRSKLTYRVTGNEKQACLRCAGGVFWRAEVSKIRKSSQSDAPKRLIGVKSKIVCKFL